MPKRQCRSCHHYGEATAKDYPRLHACCAGVGKSPVTPCQAACFFWCERLTAGQLEWRRRQDPGDSVNW